MDWIAVLPVSCSEGLLGEVLRDVEARGWRGAVSRGSEQIILSISGPDSGEEVEAVLPADADVQALLSRGDYARTARRRRLMAWMVRGLGLLVAFAGIVPVLGFLTPPDTPVGLPDQLLLGSADDVPVGEARLVRFRGRPVFVIHAHDGELLAVGATCTYAEECQLEWSDERRQLLCPCHGDVFDVYGNILDGPSWIPLRRYAVEETGGSLYLEREP